MPAVTMFVIGIAADGKFHAVNVKLLFVLVPRRIWEIKTYKD